MTARPNPVAIALVVLATATTAAGARPAGGLSSPMVDRSIYRDGAVQRSTRRFGQWTLTCDEIAGLHRRYCSLRAAASGRVSADVSTGDDGRPSVLLHLPLAVSLAFGIKAQAATEPGLRGTRATRVVAPAPSHSVTIATCNTRECLAVWTLASAELRALSSGRGLQVTYCTAKAARLEFAPDLSVSGCAATVAAWLPGTGFDDAVEASLK